MCTWVAAYHSRRHKYGHYVPLYSLIEISLSCFFPRSVVQGFQLHAAHSPTGFRLPSSSGVRPRSRWRSICVPQLMKSLAFVTHGRTGPVTLNAVQSTVGFYLHLLLPSTNIQALQLVEDIFRPNTTQNTLVDQ